MEKMNALTLIITLVVGVILTGALLGPVISDATKTTETFENDGYFTMSEINADTDITITWDHTKPTVFTVDDTDYEINVPVNRLVSIVGTDSMIIRYVSSTDGSTNRVQAYSSQGFIQAGVSTGTDMVIELTNDTITVTVGTTVKTISITEGYYIDPDGSWVMKKSDETAYIHKNDSVMIFAGITNMGEGNGDVGVYGVGTINDGMGLDVVPTSNSTPTVTFGDVTFNYNAVNGYNDLVSLSDCNFDITLSGTPDTTVSATYSYFIVPAQVTAELSHHLTPGQISLMGAIPVMVIVALLMAAVGAIALRRAD